MGTTVEVEDCEGVCHRMARALNSGLASDVQLSVAGQLYSVHRLVLSLASDVFQVMLASPNFAESRQSVVTLCENREEGAVFPLLLRYLYTGKLTLSCRYALPLLSLADKYDIRPLRALCCRFMCDRVVVASSLNLLTRWLCYSRSSYQQPLAESCLNFIKWNFECVASSDQFLRLDGETLLCLLRSDDLVVSDETSVYRHVLRWLAHVGDDGETNEDHCDAITLLRHVRFLMMSVSQLMELPSIQSGDDVRAFLIQRMVLASSAQLGFAQRDRPLTAGDERTYGPRLYTDERWCTSLTVDKFDQLPPYCTRTLVFHTPATMADRRSQLEWVVDVYPRGVWLRRAFLIGLQGKVEVPGAVSHDMRVTVAPRRLASCDCLRVRVAVMVVGRGAGPHDRYVHTVVTRCWLFSSSEPVLSFDPVLTKQQLSAEGAPSPLLLGEHRDQLCIRVVIIPMDASTSH